MNKRIPILIAGFIALGVAFAQIRPKNIVDEVIWVVGDSPILLSDVEGFRVNAEASGQTSKTRMPKFRNNWRFKNFSSTKRN